MKKTGIPTIEAIISLIERDRGTIQQVIRMLETCAENKVGVYDRLLLISEAIDSLRSIAGK